MKYLPHSRALLQVTVTARLILFKITVNNKIYYYYYYKSSDT